MKGFNIDKMLKIVKPEGRKIDRRLRFDGKVIEDIPSNENDIDDCTRFWRRMVVKAFQEKTITISEEWIKLSDFKKWWDSHYENGYEPSFVVRTRNRERFHGPETMLFVRPEVDKFFQLPTHIKQGKRLPTMLGVKVLPTYQNCYESYYRLAGKRKRLGTFPTELEAHLRWLEEAAKDLMGLIRSEPDEFTIEVLERRLEDINNAIDDKKELEFI